ncbi:hypothetical protein NB721_003819 [Xanthomonas sacchari]|nr:hypothetical protein [Xanthomonas sacchari]
MMPIFCAICFIAWVDASTASPPSTASLAACADMPSVTLALSVFCAMDAVICSSEALVSSTPAACSVAAWLSDCAVALTSSEEPASDCALALTSPTTSASRSTIACSATIALVLSLARVGTCTVRSPRAIREATSITVLGSPPSSLISDRAIRKPINEAHSAATRLPTIRVRLVRCCNCSASVARAASNSLSARRTSAMRSRMASM